MDEDCRDCRRWEEDMYWTHFQSVLFCQFLTPGFDQQLAIPKKFSNNLKEKLPETVILRGPSGAKWSVGVITSGDSLLFKQGWDVFVEDHSLQEDDILIFKYNGVSQFDVSIFDGQNFCEKEASYFVRKCVHSEQDGRSRPKGNIKESSIEDNRTKSKRLRKGGSLMPEHSGWISQADERIRKEANQSRPRLPRWDMRTRKPSKNAAAQKTSSDPIKRSVTAYPVAYTSNRRPVTEEEKEKTVQMAHAASTKDGFVVVMRPSHVYKGFYMSIPCEWATTHLSRKSQEVILRVKQNESVSEKTWVAKFYYRVHGGGLMGGWRYFAVENNLEEFDVCLFELDTGTNDAIVMNVSIFRVVEEVIPLTRVTFLSHGKPSKFPRRKMRK